MLCDRAVRTGVLGHPGEWFNPLYVRAWVRLTGRPHVDVEPFLADVLAGATTDNGVLGINTHVDQLRWWRDRELDLFGLGFDVVARITRADKLSQAISYAESLRTGDWSGGAPAPDAQTQGPTHLGVTQCLLRILDDEHWYGQRHDPDLLLRFEEVVRDDGRQALEDIGHRLGIELPAQELMPEPPPSDSTARRRRINQDRRDAYLRAITGGNAP